MVTKNAIKYVRSLSVKKFRDAEQSFVAEGPKAVADLLALLPCRQLYATPHFLQDLPASVLHQVGQLHEVTPDDIERLSLLRAPREAVAVFERPSWSYVAGETLDHLPASELCLALDGIQDPGNVGTIVRLADWFGITHLFASPDTADVFAPKVVQATMGSVGRVQVHYLDLPNFLRRLPAEVPVYGTFLDGQNLYAQKLQPHGVLVMGNEGRGISPSVAQLANRRLYIPNYPPGRATGESLNVAVATAIVCAAFRREAFG